MMKKMIMLEGGGERERERERERTRRQRKKMMMMMKNMVQIHGEERNIQMTISHRDTHKSAAQTGAVIIKNGIKNSKCRPKSNTK